MDNFFQNSPAIMSDGRSFTDYTDDTRRNEKIKMMNNIKRDDDYRLFLQKNGQELMDREWKYNKKNNGPWETECVHVYPTRTLPQFFDIENNDYNNLSILNHPRKKCMVYKDYRMTEPSENAGIKPVYEKNESHFAKFNKEFIGANGEHNIYTDLKNLMNVPSQDQQRIAVQHQQAKVKGQFYDQYIN